MYVEQNKLAIKLKEFYLLERFQVEYYNAQLSTPENEYYKQAFAKMIQVENRHVEFFSCKIREQNMKVPIVTDSVFKLAGKLVGESVEFSGPQNTCRLGEALENKAIKMYQSFIIEVWIDLDLRNTLIEFLLDEEYHALWMNKYLKTYYTQ